MIRHNNLIFVLFAAAILFSMVREWNAPIACARTLFLSSLPESMPKSPLPYAH
jgi:hypothetical protein